MAKLDFIKKSKEFLKGSVEKLPDNVDTEGLKKSMKNLVDAGAETLANMKKRGEENAQAIKKALAKEEPKTIMLTNQDALRIIYCVMAADGIIEAEEMNKYSEIALEIDEKFEEYRDDFLGELSTFTAKTQDDEDYDDFLRDYISDTVRHSKSEKKGTVPGKVLLWNLLAISYSDGSCLEIEKKLIRYCAKQLEIDKSIILEFEGYIQTLNAILNEEAWLKSSNRSFAEVDKQLNELTERKTVIMQGVYALIAEQEV